MAHETLRGGDLTAVVGDNEGYGDHRAGYNGLHRLVHAAEGETLFVPSVAGMNLEHVFDGDQELRDVDGERRVFFEPRRAPMSLKKISEVEVELHQPPTPTFHLESWTRFRLVAPHFVDFHFRCRATQHVFKHGYIGLFWASYINAPEDRSKYFRDRGAWQQLCTQRHNLHSTVLGRDDAFEAKFTPGLGDALYQHFSPLKYDEPFFYGLFRGQEMVLAFDPRSIRPQGALVRFTHSPSGGGSNAERQTTNPAWDFQFLVPKYDVLEEYGLRARLTYRPRTSRAEILRDVAAWLGEGERG
jgi:hypothetical protein